MKSESSSTASSSWPMKEVAAYGGAVAAAMAVGYAVMMHGQWRISKFRKQVVGIIPARYASSRFQGKPLVPILGKPMIQRTWERAKLATTLSQLVVATDDERIANCCRGFGADVIMTSESCRNGTERCNEALQNLNKKFDIVVNIQGDEPLIEPEIIDGVVKALQSYDAKFLNLYPGLSPTPLQLEEDLEQLKVLENGYKMKVIKVDHDAHGVDTPEDVEKIESLMRERNLS
ncbi:3-deoxy-manno-octulosonate cytidylyltransferase, mitochondrial-like protein isoform X2 [Tanacetum coccineum]|uniref:3-deoxy-manno-octulosonate cytidylyltransferase, mitochondrial-like protein isoform X2 n=1 Tax=Tanacetum coccineum TaxID=301880 RepID=A0ABQ5B2U4_9ASTR